MRTVRIILVIPILLAASITAIAQVVQPMRYTHYSFTENVNVGVSVARTTHPSAYFEIGNATGNNKGFLPPRLTTTERDAISSPAAGLFIYNRTVNRYQGYNGSSWVTINIDTSAQFITSVYRKTGTDSVFYVKGGAHTFSFIDSTGGAGTVTSVALTMPAAFSVSGSPITSSGTFAVTGAGTTLQYIRGDGTLATFLTDVRAGISLTTTGSSGAATYNSGTGVLNIPNYTAASTVPISGLTASTATNSITVGHKQQWNFNSLGAAFPEVRGLVLSSIQGNYTSGTEHNLLDVRMENTDLTGAGGTNGSLLAGRFHADGGAVASGLTDATGIVGHAIDAATTIGGKFIATGGTNNYAIIVPASSGSIGFGTETPEASSILDLTSTSQGFLAPRLTAVQMLAIGSPATGLMIYNTDSSAYCFYDGSVWLKISQGGGSGGGYTDLTEFVDQGNWKVFYSDGSGNVQELAIGDEGQVLTSNGLSSAPSWEDPTGGGVTDHGDLTGLSDDDHTIYALLAGRSGGQSLIGGTGTTDDLILQTTSGVGTTGADMIFKVGNNGGTESMRILNNGRINIGQSASTDAIVTITSTSITVLDLVGGEGGYSFSMRPQNTAAGYYMLGNGNNPVFSINGTNGDGSSTVNLGSLDFSDARPQWLLKRNSDNPNSFSIITQLSTGSVQEDRLNIIPSGELVINQGGLDRDTRIESDTHTDAFHLDGTDGAITIGAYGGGSITGTPTYLLGVTSAGKVVEVAVEPDGGGTFTTTTPVSNLDAITGEDDMYYYRMGNYVTVFGTIRINATATGAAEGRVALPIASDLSAANQLAGIATCSASGVVVTISGDATNDAATFKFIATTTTEDTYSFHFTYKVL